MKNNGEVILLKIYLFTNFSYKTKDEFFNFKDFKNFIQ